MKKKVISALFSAVFAAGLVSAQTPDPPRFKWGVSLDAHFDNHGRDVLELPTTRSQYFLSLRAMPTTGIAWGRNHSVMAGGSFMLDMGSAQPGRHEALFYYNYSSPLLSLYVGKFERRRMIGAYSRVMLSGVTSFYDTVLDGAAMQYHAPQGRAEVVVDWDGVASESRRESFRINSAGEFNPVKAHSLRWFATGYSFEMYHLAAKSQAGDDVVDHFSVNPWIGARFQQLLPWFETLIVEAGWLGSFDRDRTGGTGWLTPGGLTLDLGVQKWRIGIRNRFYSGDRQMPLYEAWGSSLYKGDPMYASARRYNYTQVYWRPVIGRGVNLNLELGFHSDLRKMALHEIIGVGVTLDDDFFRKKR